MMVTMEMMADPLESLRDPIDNPQNANGPSPAPHTTDEAHDLMTGPSAVPVNDATATPLSSARHVAPPSTALIRTPCPNVPDWACLETLLAVGEECEKMLNTVKVLADALRCLNRERDNLSLHMKGLEQELKDREVAFENRQRHQRIILEAIYGGNDAEEPAVHSGRHDH